MNVSSTLLGIVAADIDRVKRIVLVHELDA